jgi:hypothetical protein
MLNLGRCGVTTAFVVLGHLVAKGPPGEVKGDGERARVL